MLRRYIYVISVVLLLVILSGCSSDETPDDKKEYGTLTLLLGAPDFEETTRGVTLPSGYVSYLDLYPQASQNYSTIGVFATTSEGKNSGILTYTGENKWTSHVAVKDGVTYNIYGFMPKEDAENATIVMNHGNNANDFSNGATLTINSLNAVTPADVCVIVGVEKTNSTGTEGTLSLGSFSYEGSSKEAGNYAYVLLDHIYAGLHFKMNVDATYHTLRTIKLKQLKLIANISSKTVNATIKLWTKAYAAGQTGYVEASYNPIESASFIPNNEGSSGEAILYQTEEGAEDLELTTSYQTFLGCFAPSTCTNFTLVSKYDVYDRKGNLIRKDQVSSNKITLSNDMVRGKINTYNVTVTPTYLYVLSEPDLDNPTIVVN